MKITFFERKLIPGRISIEKVFQVIKAELQNRKIVVNSIKNPYSLSKMLIACFYFKKNQGEINHITGDIHWACLFLNKNKTILTIHDLVGATAYTSFWKKQLYLLIWLYLPVWKLKYITVISQKTKNEILKYCPWAEKKIRIIANPLTVEINKRNATDKSFENIKILVIGTRENKNIERILTATQNFKCSITIVGETNKSQNDLILKSEAQIILLVDITDIELSELYRTSDILCFPSLYEGFGMPIIEAQASGCVVLTSNLEPMRSISGEAAILVNPKITDDIKLKLLELVENFTLRKSLANEGYKNAARFLPGEVADQYINLYREIENG